MVGTTTCPQCLTVNPAAARFCMGCGGGLAQAAAAPSGMRFVTVAFCDISGSTQLSLRFDPQVWHAILEAYFAEVGGALVAAGGRLEKFIGDAVVGAFGADATGEDDALRAVRGALDALDQLAKRNDETIGRYGVRLSIRFGIASGRVVLAERDSSFAIGSVMNRAARLQAAAPPDGAVVDVRTWLLIREQMACQPVPPVPAKGFDKPLQAWSVARDAVQRPAEPVFVNQTEVLSQLVTAVVGAAGSAGATRIGLVGEMGSGKTRLLRRLAEAARSSQMHTLFIACQGNDEGLWRLQQIERDLSDRSPDQPAGQPAGRTAGRGGEASTAELQWRIRRRLDELSRQRPLVVVVDDYHRSSPALRGLVETPEQPAGSVVFVLAGREPPDLAGQLVRVPPLSEPDSHELLRRLHEDARTDLAAQLAPLVQRSRGNPLFLEQLAALAHDGIDDEVAPSAEAALGARIDRLPATARHVLACIGAWEGNLRPGDLDAVCDLDESQLTASLDELERHGLASNPTAAEVAYAHIVLGERARVHTAIARRLQQYALTQPALLDLAVSHATRAHRYWRDLDPGSANETAAARLAALCLVAAARHAIGRSEVRPAATLAAAARELAVPDDALRLEIAALESYALGACGMVAEALTCIDEVAQLSGNPSAQVHLGVNRMAFGAGDLDATRELAEATEDPCATSRLRTWEGLLAARAGDYPRAESLLRSAYEGMRSFGAGLGSAEIYGNLSLFLTHADTPVREAVAQCLAMREEVADAPILHAAVSCSAALLLQRSGERAAATRMLDEARSVFTGMGHVLGEAGVHEFGSVTAELSGNLAAARDAILAAQRVYQAAGAAGSAARCLHRAFVLEPAGPAPEPSGLDLAGSWEARVLRNQVAALVATDRGEALKYLDQAVAEIAAIRGAGATLIPLTGCLRIARRLADEPRSRSLHEKIMATAPLWTGGGQA